MPRKNLSKRETEVIALVAKGYSNREIATCLSLAQKTIENYLRLILMKLRVKNRRQAAEIYLSNNEKH